MTPMGRPSGRSAARYPTPRSTVRSISIVTSSLSSVMSARSGLITSTSADSTMSAAVTRPAPDFTSLSWTGWAAKLRRRSFLTFRTICVTSSLTPGIVVNSWKTSRIWMEVTAAPSSDDRRTRRSAFPRVTPYPAGSGLASYFAYEPCSATGSIWVVASSSIMGSGLPRVVLDHELLVELERHLVAARGNDDRAREVGRVESQPLGDLPGANSLADPLERLSLTPRDTDLDSITRLAVERWNVGRAAVDGEVAVGHELPRVVSRGRDAKPEDDVVEPELQDPEEVLARHAGARLGLLAVVVELTLQDAVDAADLLLLAKLETIVA